MPVIILHSAQALGPWDAEARGGKCWYLLASREAGV